MTKTTTAAGQDMQEGMTAIRMPNKQKPRKMANRRTLTRDRETIIVEM